MLSLEKEPYGFEDMIDADSQNWKPPNCDDSPSTLGALDQANPDPYCGPQYIIPILASMMDKAIADFESILNDGYDKYFGLYAGYVVDSSRQNLVDFMKEKGGEYFDCQVIEKITCCRNCWNDHGENSNACQHCSLPYCSGTSLSPPPFQPARTWGITEC